jgi:hypothetical protein
MAVYESEEGAKQAVDQFAQPPGEIITIEAWMSGRSSSRSDTPPDPLERSAQNGCWQSIPFQTRSPSREGSGGSRGDVVLWWTQAGAISSITPPLGAATSQPWSLPQLWIRVKVRPHLAGSANSDSASRRSKASSSSLSVSSRRDSSATLN